MRIRLFTTFTSLRARRQAHRIASVIVHPPMNPTIVPPLPKGPGQVETTPLTLSHVLPPLRVRKVSWVGQARHDLTALIRVLYTHRIWVGAAVIVVGSALNLYCNWEWF